MIKIRKASAVGKTETMLTGGKTALFEEYRRWLELDAATRRKQPAPTPGYTGRLPLHLKPITAAVHSTLKRTIRK